MENTTKNLFETLAETQKQVIDNMTNATQQMAKTFFNNEMNSDFFKKWYDSQMSFFNQNNKNEQNPAHAFTNWMNAQMGLYNEYMTGMQKNMSTAFNPSQFGINNDMFTGWLNNMNQMVNTMTANMQNMEPKNMMSGMFNNTEYMMKMYEMWMPFAKMVNDKTFTPEAFKSMFNPTMFKDMMDKMMNFQPDAVKNMMNMNMFRDAFMQMAAQGKSNMDNMSANYMNQLTEGKQVFGKMFDTYNDMWNSMNQAAAPMMKMLGNTPASNQMNMMNELMNHFNHFMLKNTEVQYATYQAALEGMNEFGDHVYNKMKNGEDMSNFMQVYSDWLNTIDKHLTKLFATPEYSKMQAELNTFGMRMKQHMNAQMEKSMEHIPVVVRTEMDELYKTIYELKKRVNMLEKQLDDETVAPVEPKATTKKSTKTA